MKQLSWCGLTITALLLSAVAVLAYPSLAGAQQAADAHRFGMRMGARIDAVQVRIRNLEKELTGGEKTARGSGEFEADGGLLRQLKDIDEQCRDLERELDSMAGRSAAFPGQLYEQQRQIEYQIYALDRQVQQIRRWMHPEEVETESSVEPRPEIDTEEDGISDEDWAAEWAKGDQ